MEQDFSNEEILLLEALLQLDWKSILTMATAPLAPIEKIASELEKVENAGSIQEARAALGDLHRRVGAYLGRPELSAWSTMTAAHRAQLLQLLRG